jgi:hypothetical protein
LTAWNSAWLKVPGTDPKSDPTSFVAAEIHLGPWPAGICDTLAALQHSSCVPDRVVQKYYLYQLVNWMARDLTLAPQYI